MVKMSAISVQTAWVVITIVICAVSFLIVIRLIFLYVLKKNLCNAARFLGSIRFFQTESQRRTADLVAAGLSNTFKEQPFPAISFVQPQFVAATMTPDHTAIEINPIDTPINNPAHWPVFQIARNGELTDVNRLVVGDVPSYQSLASHHPNSEPSTLPDPASMSSAQVLRNSIEPLGMNNSLNIQRNENQSGVGGGMASYMQNNNASVPLDRPLYINTTMSAQHRIDLYRMLVEPPQDSEPALQFRIP